MRLLAVLLVALMAAAQPLLSQADPDAAVTLRGLSGIKVVIEDMPDAWQAGIDTAALRVAVELEFRRNGVVVSSQYAEYFYLNITLGQISANTGWAYSYAASFGQAVILARDPSSPPVVAYTWNSGGLGYARPAAIASAVQHHALNLVQRFVNDYLRVNPVR